MKLVILAGLMGMVAGVKCPAEDGVTVVADNACACGGDAVTTDTPEAAVGKFCAKTRDGKFLVLAAALTDKCGADAENADKAVCGCEKAGAADVFVELCVQTDTCKSADGTCQAKAGGVAKCPAEDGVTVVADNACACGGDAVTTDTPEAAVGKFCAKTRDGKFHVLDAALTDKCGADVENADKDACGCEKEGKADVFVELCIKTDTCQKADGTCKAKAGAATTTKKATTKAGAATTKKATTKAAAGGTTASATTASASVTPAEAELAAKNAHKAALAVMKLVTEDAVKAALAVGKPTAVEAPAVKKFEAGKGATVTATITGDPNADAALKKTLDAWFCGLMKVPVDMCKATYTKAARVLADNERRLAGTKMDVAIAMKTEVEYAKEKKDAAAAAQKTLSSGATSFGVAAAIGLVVVLY